MSVDADAAAPVTAVAVAVAVEATVASSTPSLEAASPLPAVVALPAGKLGWPKNRTVAGFVVSTSRPDCKKHARTWRRRRNVEV